MIYNVEGNEAYCYTGGKAFDAATGWHIAYHLTPAGPATLASDYHVARAAAYDQHWSDHAPVVVDYAL